MRATANAQNLRQYKSRFSLIVELTLAFDSSPNSSAFLTSVMVGEVKNLSPDFK